MNILHKGKSILASKDFDLEISVATDGEPEF